MLLSLSAFPFSYYFTYCPRDQIRIPTHPGDKKLLDEYDVRVSLGSGNFGTVQMGINRTTGEKVAVKSIDKKKLYQQSSSFRKTTFMDEFNIMKRLSHPNIVKVYDAFEGANSNYIIME